MARMFENYLQNIFSKLKTGEASERTYYSPLEDLLKNFREGSQIIVEARKSSVGIPDFKVRTAKDLLIGYIEAKDLGRDLDHLSKDEDIQIDKYRKEYPKLIVTNFIEFRLYENGELVETVFITQPVTIKLGVPVLDNEGKAKGLFERFFSTTIPEVHTSKMLSQLLAHKTRVLRDLILEEIDMTDDNETETEKLLETFKKSLKPDMTPEIFSDMYAQTITFGLFVGRINSDHQEFTRFTAHSLIPHTIPLLKKIFWVLSGQDVPQHIEWQVDEIAEILANTKIEKITEEFFSHGKGRDPIVHFYETFLEEYDSSQREQLGVYYTPPSVVSYITKSLNKILKKNFGKKEGFADKSVITLDPAAGTLTFPAEAISIAKNEFVSSNGSGGWDSLVKEHILKDFYAFEILMAPYAVGHLKISLLLKELGYNMGQDERFELYLTNTLDMSKFQPQQTILAEEISQESEKAYEIKNNVPVIVVMGNPPYSGESSNKGEWIEKQIEEYKKVDGQPLGEKNPKWLNDDYVKFIRFAQWKIEKTGQGVLGFITNHAWLDNPTFKGMRNSLMRTFNEIYVVDLHGSILKKEKVPKDVQKLEGIGEKDEGIFGIRPGTSILLAIKSGNSSTLSKVYRSEQWGSRDRKFEWLDKHDIENTRWNILTPNKPSYFFVEKNEKVWSVYKNFISITDIFPLNSIGIQSHRDNLVVNFNPESIKKKFGVLWNADLPDQIVAEGLDIKDTDTWKISEKRNPRIVGENWEKKILPVLYRPFDTRWIFYDKEFVDRPRNAVMEHMTNGDNLMLLVPRAAGSIWEHAFVTNSLAVDVAISARSREANQTFPLYMLNDSSQGVIFDSVSKGQNINWGKLPQLISTLQPYTSPATNNFLQPAEQIFYYVYAILYSNIYRKKYQEFLGSDFPKIPFTDDYETLKTLVILGEQLVNLHLLKSKVLDTPMSRYEGSGDNMVTKREFVKDSSRLYVNDTQFFDKVSPEVWNYFIGGYQVLDKWLKDRIGRALTLEDQLHFRKIITALTETIELQKRIDKVYPKVEETLSKI